MNHEDQDAGVRLLRCTYSVNKGKMRSEVRPAASGRGPRSVRSPVRALALTVPSGYLENVLHTIFTTECCAVACLRQMWLFWALGFGLWALGLDWWLGIFGGLWGGDVWVFDLACC